MILTLNPAVLAYIGDAVYEVLVRTYLVESGIVKVKDLQTESIKYVSANSQADILKKLVENNILTEDEQDIIRNGRNYKRSTHPKNTNIITYKYSTGFEALIGYLYLESKINRINEIFNYIKECK